MNINIINEYCIVLNVPINLSTKMNFYILTQITFMNLDDGSVYVTAAKDVYVNKSKMINLGLYINI